MHSSANRKNCDKHTTQACAKHQCVPHSVDTYIPQQQRSHQYGKWYWASTFSCLNRHSSRYHHT